MLNELKSKLNELKSHYYSEKLLSIHESVIGCSLCDKILKQLNIIENQNISDIDKINMLIRFIKEKLEETINAEEGADLMSDLSFNLITTEEILEDILNLMNNHYHIHIK